MIGALGSGEAEFRPVGTRDAPPQRMPTRRPFRKKLFAGLAVLAGIVLLAFEMFGRGAASAGEGWFWIAVAVGLIGLGLAELASSSPAAPPRKLGE